MLQCYRLCKRFLPSPGNCLGVWLGAAGAGKGFVCPYKQPPIFWGSHLRGGCWWLHQQGGFGKVPVPTSRSSTAGAVSRGSQNGSQSALAGLEPILRRPLGSMWDFVLVNGRAGCSWRSFPAGMILGFSSMPQTHTGSLRRSALGNAVGSREGVYTYLYPRKNPALGGWDCRGALSSSLSGAKDSPECS